MKVFNQLAVILGIWAIGEYISSLISGFIAIPGSIIGMLLLFIMLQTKVISIESVDSISSFFLDNMALFFVPAGVSLITSLDIIKSNIIVLIATIFITTVIVMWVTGIVVEVMMSRKEGKKNV
ncbi:CidA/LrgA family protein [Peptacetobacter hominis]|uniref:CidA/LrgA family protein n=1 Tax=Peptacetobacter hominis TaxID=2743610 RepID=A0A544QYQ2_9FIRM|nr:CidA/LrgA family protein [Peptacetobacter hominis]TQQ85831.1 CidA/LrgA family protein [Peptacetobacter hominis]